MLITETNLRRFIRKSIQQHEQTVLEEGILGDAIGWMKEKGESTIKGTKKFFQDLKSELSETGDGLDILKNMVLGKEVSPEDNEFLINQIKDIGKGIPLLGLLFLPGGGLAATALVKLARKMGVELMPSSFQENKI